MNILKQLFLIALLCSLSKVNGFAQPGPSQILGEILTNIESNRAPIIITEGPILPSLKVLEQYRTNGYQLLWTQGKADELIETIGHAPDEGLNPEDYYFQALQRLQAKSRDEDERAIYDILLTDGFFKYAMDLSNGREDPCLLYNEKWEPSRSTVNLSSLLQEALHAKPVAEVLQSLLPAIQDYKKLKEKLLYFRSIDTSDWHTLPEAGSLSVGVLDSRIPEIRKRLAVLAQQPVQKNNSTTYYDSLLFWEVMAFQKRNGMVPNGVIDSPTLRALNFSIGYYISKIRLNLERYRWLPDNFGDRYIMINIPSFSFELMEKDSLVMAMKAIVGRPDRMTPVFSSRMSYLIYNPTWTVPPTILEKDALPAIKKNTNYLTRNHLRVLDRSGNELRPDSLPWSHYTITNFPFVLRQDPGSFNALGLIKFEFPNHFSVYLHDTNNHALFRQPYRALSSGCIRIEKPFDLADYLLKNTSKNIRLLVASGATGTATFSPSIAIHIVYMTAFVDANNQLNLRDDIYNWDGILAERLTANPRIIDRSIRYQN